MGYQLMTKNWNIGEGSISVSHEKGSGSATILIQSTANEGIDREMPITISGGGITKTFKVSQEGKRQRFITKDGMTLNGSDKIFLTIKQNG